MNFTLKLVASVTVAESDTANQISVECAQACNISDAEAQRATYAIPLVTPADASTVTRIGTVCPLTQQMWDWLAQHDGTSYEVLQRIPSLQFALLDANDVLISSNLPGLQSVVGQAVTVEQVWSAGGLQRKVEAMPL